MEFVLSHGPRAILIRKSPAVGEAINNIKRWVLIVTL